MLCTMWVEGGGLSIIYVCSFTLNQAVDLKLGYTGVFNNTTILNTYQNCLGIDRGC